MKTIWFFGLTFKPASTSFSATAAPMPELAPVTMATFPDQRCIDRAMIEDTTLFPKVNPVIYNNYTMNS